MIRSRIILKNETDSPAGVNTLSKKFPKNPARWTEPPDQARTRSPSHLPAQTAIGTKAPGLLFLRRKVASAEPLSFIPILPIIFSGICGTVGEIEPTLRGAEAPAA